MLVCNGVTLPTPTTLEFNIYDVESEHSGTTLGGDISKKILRTKEDLIVTWSQLSQAEMEQLAPLKNSTYVTLEYYSPRAGDYVTRVMATEDLQYSFVTGKSATYGIYSASVTFKQK